MKLEMMNQNEHAIQYTAGKVAFNAFDYYRGKCMEIAEYMNSLVLTEENIKEVKHDLADCRKVVYGLDSKRKSIKKEILADYTIFEQQIKELTSILDGAEGILRKEIRQLEEMERMEKRGKIEEIWNQRISFYDIHSIVPDLFERFIQPSHLNKTVSLKAVEKEMTNWLETRQMEMDTIHTMQDADEILVEYCKSLDLSNAIKVVSMNHQLRESIQKTTDANPEVVESAAFIIKGKAQIKLVELLLKENQIEYTKR